MPPDTAAFTPYLNEPLDPEDFEIAVQVLQMIGDAHEKSPVSEAEAIIRPFSSPFDKDAA